MSIVWRINVTLRDVRLTVWRTILIRPETKLAMLHRYIQAAMGWLDCHLFLFTINGKEYGIPNGDLDMKVYDARRYPVNRLFAEPLGRLRYVDDFGDWWEHDIEILGEEEALYRRRYPICVDGAEACPPEDCGGPAGYGDVLEALRDERNPRHDEIRAWAQSQLYRERFSSQVATWSMRDVQRGYR